jgi:RND family efflux transporter MFP subunit
MRTRNPQSEPRSPGPDFQPDMPAYLRPGARPAAVGFRLSTVLLALVIGCGRHGEAGPTKMVTVPPSQTRLKRNVELGQVQRAQLSAYVETVGYLEAEGQTNIAAGITGIVDEVLFREGQEVDRDSVLVLVDQERYQTALEVARANVDLAERDLTGAIEAERIARQAGPGSTVKEKSDALRDLGIAQARLSAARSNRRLAEINLKRSQVRAPYPGKINQRLVTPGTYLEEKTVIATMADLSRLRLAGFVPEKTAALVRQMVQQEEQLRTAWLMGSCFVSPSSCVSALVMDANGEAPAAYRIEFELRPYPNQTFHGRIFYMSTVASPDTHMFECKAEVPRRAYKEGLRPGFSAKIRCPLPTTANSLVIPEEAVRSTERGPIVFRPRPIYKEDGSIESWVAETITLETGMRQPGFVEVLGVGRPGLVEILKGLSPGDWIIRKGAESLEDNTPINIPEAQERMLLQLHEANRQR